MVTVIIPTIGRNSMYATHESVVADGIPAEDIHVLVDTTLLGAYGHPVRNAFLDDHPDLGGYCWSIDDDDVAAPGAADTIRKAIDSFPGAWFIFQMRGGPNSHFPGQVVPSVGKQIRVGNVGTPCIVWPASAKARWGTGEWVEIEPGVKVAGPRDTQPGYYGDYEFAAALQAEFGDPVWIDEVVAVIRP